MSTQAKVRLQCEKIRNDETAKKQYSRGVTDIPPETYEKDDENSIERVGICKATIGGHLLDIMFHA